MSESIPSSPILMRVSNKIRDFITPNQNILYLLLESALLSSLMFVYYYRYIGVSEILYTLPSIGFLIMVLVRVVTVQPDKWKKEQYSMEFSFKLTVFCILLALIPVGIVYYQYGQIATTEISAIALPLYGGSLYTRSRKYLGERKFYTDTYSNASQEWEMASVSLEKAMKQEDKGNDYRAYYWSMRASSYYEEIVEKEERLALREAASAYSAGCEFLSVSIFTEGNESYSFYSAAEESFDRARNKLSERICDNCGRRRKINRCERVIGEEEKRYVYCDNCRRNKQTSSTSTGQKTSQKRNSQHKSRRQSKADGGSGKTGKSRTDRNGKGEKTSRERNNSENDTNSQYTKTQQKNNGLSRKEALKILGIDEENPTDDRVHGAFREKVKKSHPDTGGSEEEFKKVKRAREKLI